MFLCWRRDSVWAQVEESAMRVCPLWGDGQEGGGGHTDEAAHHRPLEADQEAGHTTHHQHAHRLPGGPREVGRGDGAQDGQQHHHVTSRHVTSRAQHRGCVNFRAPDMRAANCREKSLAFPWFLHCWHVWPHCNMTRLSLCQNKHKHPSPS